MRTRARTPRPVPREEHPSSPNAPPPGGSAPAPERLSDRRRSESPPLRLVNAFWDRNALSLVERTEDGGVRVREERAEHASFVRRAELPDAIERQLRASARVRGLRDEPGGWVRISWTDRWSSLEAHDALGRAGVVTYEADVDPVRIFLTDNPGAEIARPRRVYLDVESDSRVPGAQKEDARLLAWALVDEEGALVASAVLASDSDEEERLLLLALWAKLDAFDQIVAWGGDFFDFPYVLARTQRRRIAVDPRRWLFLDQVTLFRRMNLGGAGDEKRSHKLGDVAVAVKAADGKSSLDGEEALSLVAYLLEIGSALGAKYSAALRAAGRIVVGGADSWPLFEAGGPARALLLRYCERDTWLCHAIEQKTGFVGLLFALCQATACFPSSKGLRPTQQVEGFLLRLGRAKGLRFPTHRFGDHDDEEPFKGAYVEPTVPGMHRAVHVCDFERLYPSVAMTFNLSPETTRGRLVGSDERIPDGCCVVPLTRVVVANEPRGVLPTAFEELLRLRKVWDDKKSACAPGTPEWIDADRRSDAYKRAINAFFGVMGTAASRFFQRDVAESMTQGGAWLIKQTLAAAKLRGYEAVGGDTDSAFVVGCSDDEFRAFVQTCNDELFPRLVKERGAVRNHIRLAYEKKFRLAVFLIKKRYAASYEHFKGKAATSGSKLEIKGLEYKRGDSLRVACEFQLEIVEKLLREECSDPRAFAELVEARKRHVLEAPMGLEDVVLSKYLTKPLGAYVRRQKDDGTDAAQSAHVEVARVLRERGRDVGKGQRIEYVVVDGSVSPGVAIPAEDFDGTFDRYYLWEQLVWPPSMRVLAAAFPSFDWTPWDRVRPRAPRIGGRKISDKQLGFGWL